MTTMLACLLVDTPQNRAFMESLDPPLDAKMLAGIFTPYKDSVEAACAQPGCGRPIWVGPESQKVAADWPEAPVVCLPCSAIIAARNGARNADDVDIRVLTDKKAGE